MSVRKKFSDLNTLFETLVSQVNSANHVSASTTVDEMINIFKELIADPDYDREEFSDASSLRDRIVILLYKDVKKYDGLIRSLLHIRLFKDAWM